MLNDAEFIPVIVAVPSVTAAPELLVNVAVLLTVSFVNKVPKSMVIVGVVKGVTLLSMAVLALSIPAPQFFRVAQS